MFDYKNVKRNEDSLEKNVESENATRSRAFFFPRRFFSLLGITEIVVLYRLLILKKGKRAVNF